MKGYYLHSFVDLDGISPWPEACESRVDIICVEQKVHIGVAHTLYCCIPTGISSYYSGGEEDDEHFDLRTDCYPHPFVMGPCDGRTSCRERDQKEIPRGQFDSLGEDLQKLGLGHLLEKERV